MNKFIRHAVFVERFKNGEALRMGTFIQKEVLPALEAKIQSFLAKKLSVTRLKELEASLKVIMDKAMSKAGATTIKNLKAFSSYEAKWTADTLRKTIPVDVSLTMPAIETLHKLVTSNPFDGHKLQTWLTGYSTAAKTKMMKQIRVGMAIGESLPSIGKRIRDVMTVKRKQAEYIARTAVSSVTNAARDEVYKRNADLIRGVQWVSTLDDRTTLICINLDGRVFTPDDGPRPPAHFNCRSICIPVVTSWNELGIEPPPPATRASMNGAVAEKTTYKDWFKNQPKSTQEDILGSTRFASYEKGTPLTGFVGKDYQPISLKKLSKRENVIFEESPVVSSSEAAGRASSVLPGRIEATSAESLRKQFLLEVSREKPVVVNTKKLQSELSFYEKDKVGLLSKSATVPAEQKLLYQRQLSSVDRNIERISTKLSSTEAKAAMSISDQRKILFAENNYGGLIPDIKKTAANDILKMIPKGRLSEFEIRALKNLRVFFDKSLQASHYSPEWSSMYMRAEVPSSFVHEFAHHLSYRIKGVMSAQNNFFLRRTAGEKTVTLPGTSVLGKKDKFGKLNYYAGRIYSNGETPEIISIGMEKVWKNPAKVARDDPEWFDLVMTALRGFPE